MKASILVCCLLPIGLWGCGDDSASDGGAGSGGSGGSADGGGGGTGATGATGGTGGTSGAGGNLTKAECLAMSVQTLPTACLDCACTTNANVTAQCGEGCWQLLLCVGLACGGKVDDLNCIGAKCTEYIGGITDWAGSAAQAMAMVASPVILACADVCIAGDGDGGVDADGGP